MGIIRHAHGENLVVAWLQPFLLLGLIQSIRRNSPERPPSYFQTNGTQTLLTCDSWLFPPNLKGTRTKKRPCYCRSPGEHPKVPQWEFPIPFIWHLVSLSGLPLKVKFVSILFQCKSQVETVILLDCTWLSFMNDWPCGHPGSLIK